MSLLSMSVARRKGIIEGHKGIMQILDKHKTNTMGLLFCIDQYDLINTEMQDAVKKIVTEIGALEDVKTSTIWQWFSFVDSHK